jgi:hypothetical protein
MQQYSSCIPWLYNQSLPLLCKVFFLVQLITLFVLMWLLTLLRSMLPHLIVTHILKSNYLRTYVCTIFSLFWSKKSHHRESEHQFSFTLFIQFSTFHSMACSLFVDEGDCLNTSRLDANMFSKQQPTLCSFEIYCETKSSLLYKITWNNHFSILTCSIYFMYLFDGTLNKLNWIEWKIYMIFWTWSVWHVLILWPASQFGSMEYEVTRSEVKWSEEFLSCHSFYTLDEYIEYSSWKDWLHTGCFYVV